MKITYKKGNALEGPEEYLLHGCNNRGVMGSGIAKQIRLKYPEAYNAYKIAEKSHGLIMGSISFYNSLAYDKVIFNCITQDGYGNDGKQYVSYDAILDCIISLNKQSEVIFQKVAMPKIGAGLGGGDWDTISMIFEEHSMFYPVVYEL